MKYLIKGIYRGRTEVIDEATTRKEAVDLRREYQMAFGVDWVVYAEEAEEGA